MTTRIVGILHPGQMGVSIAASAVQSGNTVYWASTGRSPETHARAAEHGLVDVTMLETLCARSEVILSVCPPDAAEDVAKAVAGTGFSGLYVDANAIAPQRAIRISEVMDQAGADFVDGSIIGGPAWKPNATWLYLSGPKAQKAADLFVDGLLETAIIGTELHKASALKMCYAAFTKGSTALLCAILATADELGVRDELQGQWSRNGSTFSDETTERVRNVTAKAWRFVGEMDEISATFQGAGLPGDFHAGAADVYQRIAEFKDAPSTPPLEDVLAALQQK